MATNYNDFNQCYAQFRLYNSFNLMCIAKNRTYAIDLLNEIKIRIVACDELNLTIEIPPTFYEMVFKKRVSRDHMNYVNVYQKDEGDNKINDHFYYLKGFEVTDSLSHIVYLTLDALYEYRNKIFDDQVIISSESRPSANTKYSGQKTTFSWIGETETKSRIDNFFPYLSNGEEVMRQPDNVYDRTFIVSIATSRIFDGGYNGKYNNAMSPIGCQYYSMSLGCVEWLIERISSKSIWDDFINDLIGGDMKNALGEIKRLPFAIKGDATTPTEPIYIGGGTYHIAGTATIDEQQRRYFANYKYFMCSDPIWGNYVKGKYYAAETLPFHYTYNVNQVDRMELHLPFVDIDLSNYIEYFDGEFSAGYIIDVSTGKGCLGIVKGQYFNPKIFDAISDSLVTPLDIIVPIEVSQSVEWTVIESNTTSKMFSLASSAFGLAKGNVGAAFVGLNSLFSDPTTITPHSATSPAGAENMAIFGLVPHYGLKVVGKAIGTENNGFSNERIVFSSIPTQSMTHSPNANTYNIQKVLIEKKKWTPYEEVNDEIYRCLTEVGFVKNV